MALFAAALAGFAGCATKPEDRNGPRAREDVAEYRQIALDAQKVVKATLQSLDRAAAHTSCPPRVFKAFTQDVQRLEVDSFKMRARAQAMRARPGVFAAAARATARWPRLWPTLSANR